MRIDEARIDSYGEKTNATFDFSRGSFYLAFGPNEAGKSSFLEFIRNLLFDLPTGGASGPFFSGLGAATLGGSAKFRLDDGRTGRVRRDWKLGETRRKSSFEGSLRDPRTGVDAALDADAFVRLLGGADRRFFATYFGFSYRELAEGEALLTETGLSELIYGFGVGGPKVLNETKKALKKRLDESFSPAPNAKNKKINAAVRRLKELDDKIKKTFGSAREYSTLCRDRDEVFRETETLRGKREGLAAERRDWEKMRTARTLFDAAESAAGEAAEFLENSPFSAERFATFPEDGLAERRALSETLKQYGDEIDKLLEQLEAARSRRSRIERTPRLIAEQARIRGASRRVEEIARERAALPNDSARIERDAAELARRGAEIGVAASAFRDEAAISDATLARARAEAAEENRLDEEARTAEKAARDRRDEIAELERVREQTATRRIAEFGERDRTNDEIEFLRIDKAFPATRDAAERAAKEDAALAARRSAEDATARRLVRELFAAPSNDFAADSAALESANVPLSSALSELERRDAEIVKARDAARADAARLDAEIERLDERLNAANDWNATSADELARLRRDRNGRWTAIKTAWLAGDFSTERAATATGEFERSVERADAVADARFDNAKSVADWEAATRAKTAKIAERVNVAERIRRADEATVELAAKTRDLWRRAGLDVRADFSLAEAREWRALWETWTSARLETRRREAELSAEKERLRDAARASARLAARWLVDADADVPTGDLGARDGDGVRLDAIRVDVININGETPLATAFEDVARLLARAEKRVERWRETVASTRATAARVDAAETTARRFELDAEAAARRRADSAARFRAFRAELADGAIPLDADSARSFGELASTLEKLRDLQKEARRIADERARLTERTERVAQFEREIADLATALGAGPLDARTRAEDAAAVWSDRLQEASDAENAWKTESQNVARIEAELDAKRSAAAAKEARRRELIASVGAASDAEFSALGVAAQEARRLGERRDETAARLRAAFLEQSDADFARRLDSLRAVDGAEVDAKIADLARQTAELDAQTKESSDRLVEIRTKIAVLERQDGASLLAVERERSASELREAIDLFVPRLFAFSALENSLRRCEEEKRPQILDDANAIFERVTSGRYSRIVAENDAFEAIQRDGIAKSPRELSSGTREQLYLALRLAHIRRYCESSESLPLLTDDVLINFDDARAEETLRVLLEFAQNTQVILLTCRESTRRAFERIVGKEPIVELAGRRFDAR